MTNPGSALLRSKGLLIALMVLGVIAVVVVGLLASGGDDKPEAINNAEPSPSATATVAPTTATPSPTKATTTAPVKQPKSTLKCIRPDELFNVEGADVDTLRPDCGDEVVAEGAPLGFGCGGRYPTIMYKTTTAKSKATVCGTNSSGEDLRMVTKGEGGGTLDLKANYEPGLDAFVAKNDGATYIIEAYNGSLTVDRNGTKDRQETDNWISLDNESDYD